MCNSSNPSPIEAVIKPPIFLSHEVGAVMPTRADSPTGMYLYHFAQSILERAGFEIENLPSDQTPYAEEVVRHFKGKEFPKGLDSLTIETNHIKLVIEALDLLLLPQNYETLRTRSPLLLTPKEAKEDEPSQVVTASEIAIQMRDELTHILYPPEQR